MKGFIKVFTTLNEYRKTDTTEFYLSIFTLALASAFFIFALYVGAIVEGRI